ncbi:MAG: hypothetical protein RBR86_06035 [Pseudobdellovibrionaceae bacterium]|jgi:hypothetical protein|nr:hypothetical protein [Pseudobdellovibrionaceae bacterium]
MLMKLLKPTEQNIFLMDPYQVGQMFDGFAFGSNFPQMVHLLNEFHKAGGQFAIGLNQDRAVADYVSGKNPLVRYYARPTASVTIHELAHHRQAMRLPEFWQQLGSMHPVIGMWIEADARVHEALHALEVIEYFKTTGQSVSMVFRDPGYYEDLLRLDAMCDGTFCDLKDIARSRYTLSDQERLKFLRNVFDQFIDGFSRDAQRNMAYVTTFSESMASFNTNMDRLSRYYLKSSVSWAALTVSMMPLSVAVIPAAIAGIDVYRQKQFIESVDVFYNAPTAEYTEEKLKRLGELPCRYGNYLTGARGQSLTSEFYRAVSPMMQNLISEYRDELHSRKITERAKEFFKRFIPPLPFV